MVPVSTCRMHDALCRYKSAILTFVRHDRIGNPAEYAESLLGRHVLVLAGQEHDQCASFTLQWSLSVLFQHAKKDIPPSIFPFWQHVVVPECRTRAVFNSSWRLKLRWLGLASRNWSWIDIVLPSASRETRDTKSRLQIVLKFWRSDQDLSSHHGCSRCDSVTFVYVR
jgi:hypothetical protein